MSEDLVDELASLAADARGWLQFQRSLGADLPWGEAPEIPGAPRPSPASGRGPAAPGPRRLPRAGDLPAAAPRRGPRLPRSGDLPAAPPRPAGHPPASAPASTGPQTLPMVREDLGDCTRCKLARGRTHLVFGAGNPNADIVFVGEGPGYHEDQQGVPFVGKAGALLDRIITNVLRLERDDVYICNVLKCRPPNNRDPEPDEVARCAPFLHRQLAAIRPKVVVGLGRFAVNNLLGTTGSLARARGVAHPLPGAVLVATYHPAYLLRNPEDKRKTMQDMMLVRQEFAKATGSPLPDPIRGRR